MRRQLRRGQGAQEKFGGVVIAPHPFYPGSTCLGRAMDRYADLFDAVEFSWFYTATSQCFNDRAVAWAKRHGRPVVANGDVHRLIQLGRTYSLVDAAPSPASICDAVRAGRLSIVTEPIGSLEAAAYFGSLVAADARKWWRGLVPVPGQPGGAEQGPEASTR
jgi:predicted metal-dependent phosphoesterase TrpH